MVSTPDQQLEDLRREVDRLDSAMVDLLAERMRVVEAISQLKRTEVEDRPAIRPGREAIILRRLVRHAGERVPTCTLVRMWRELLAATTRMQGPLGIIVCVPPEQPRLWDVARDHFGSLTPIQRTESASQALRLAAEDPSRLAVLPLPDERRPWWISLLEGSSKPLRIVARLPFAASMTDGDEALVVGRLEPEPSGDDACVIAVETGDEISQGRLLDVLADAGLAPRWLAAWRPAHGGAVHLLELEGRLRLEGDPGGALAGGREHVLRVVWLGGYARPLAGGT